MSKLTCANDRRHVLAVLVGVVLLLAGCGSKENRSATTATSTTPPSSTTAITTPINKAYLKGNEQPFRFRTSIPSVNVSTRAGQLHIEPGVDSATQTLPAPQRPLGRLALLAALASHQVDAQVLHDARTRPGPAGDEALVAAAGWASFAAARRIGSWLHPTHATATNGRHLTR